VDPDALDRALDEEIRGLAETAPEEVKRAVRLMESRQLAELQEVGDRADQLSMHTCLFDDPGRINTELDRVRAVDAERVRAFAAAHLESEHAASLVYVPRGGAA
jgi:predicted Zn-dependent peptidase